MAEIPRHVYPPRHRYHNRRPRIGNISPPPSPPPSPLPLYISHTQQRPFP